MCMQRNLANSKFNPIKPTLLEILPSCKDVAKNGEFTTRDAVYGVPGATV